SDEERLYFLGRELEGLRGTFFRQSMFAEFELQIHEVVERGETLSADRFTAMYADLLRGYHGHDEGILTVADDYTVEWAYIPHFYYNFYVYQYATSVAASSLLVERLRKGEAGAADRYLALLASGGSEYPYEQLVEAGVDLANPEPYEALMRRMSSIMDEIDRIVGI
ncbi:MAG: M3 family metallopeptidase, partial [Gemmatimonadota bacterium]|nr:M3 family metallopeptidase [Gemmatimonadota bacterium]